MSWTRGLFLALALLGVIYLLLPGPIDPLSYQPPEAPALEGPLAPNEDLRSAETIAAGRVEGPEDVAVDAHGRIYGGTLDGRIVRVTHTQRGRENVETFASTSGRPLGMDFDTNTGNLIVADAVHGLLSFSPQGELTTLATEAEGEPFGLADDLDVATDGTVYLSDASSRHTLGRYLYDLLEARPHGRLVRFDPATHKTEVLLRDLYFANGIALSSDESFVLVNETYRYRITRYWLRGPRAGTSEVFVENLPGFPDGVSASGRGTFWVALYTVRNPVMDGLHPSPFKKRLMAKLPRFVWPKPEPYGLVIELDETGRILRSLHDTTGEHVAQVTSAEEAGGYLYLGNLGLDYMSRLRL